MAKKYIHAIKTTKFKDVTISIRFLGKLSELDATHRSILALMLGDKCSAYPTKKMMNDQLDKLYGANLYASTAGYGRCQVLEIKSQIVHPSYLPYPNIFLDWLKLLNQVVYEPLWDTNSFEEAQHILKAKITRNNDEPSQYAISQAFKIAGKSQPLGISALGTIEACDGCTLKEIKNTYQKMINNNQMEIIIGGDLGDDWVDLIGEYFPQTPNATLISCAYKINKIDNLGKKVQHRNITQSNIVMVYGTETKLNDDDYYALRVANALLGQYSTSLLFQEVREKHSLCYSIFSSLLSFDAAMGIVTGVEDDNINTTIKLITKQVHAIENGEFDDSLLDTVKGMIINTLIASEDSMSSLIAQRFQNILLNMELDTRHYINKIQEVNKELVVKAIHKCYPVLTFVLTKGDDEHASK